MLKKVTTQARCFSSFGNSFKRQNLSPSNLDIPGFGPKLIQVLQGNSNDFANDPEAISECEDVWNHRDSLGDSLNPSWLERYMVVAFKLSRSDLGVQAYDQWLSDTADDTNATLRPVNTAMRLLTDANRPDDVKAIMKKYQDDSSDEARQRSVILGGLNALCRLKQTDAAMAAYHRARESGYEVTMWVKKQILREAAETGNTDLVKELYTEIVDESLNWETPGLNSYVQLLLSDCLVQVDPYFTKEEIINGDLVARPKTISAIMSYLQSQKKFKEAQKFISYVVSTSNPVGPMSLLQGLQSYHASGNAFGAYDLWTKSQEIVDGNKPKVVPDFRIIGKVGEIICDPKMPRRTAELIPRCHAVLDGVKASPRDNRTYKIACKFLLQTALSRGCYDASASMFHRYEDEGLADTIVSDLRPMTIMRLAKAVSQVTGDREKASSLASAAIEATKEGPKDGDNYPQPNLDEMEISELVLRNDFEAFVERINDIRDNDDNNNGVLKDYHYKAALDLLSGNETYRDMLQGLVYEATDDDRIEFSRYYTIKIADLAFETNDIDAALKAVEKCSFNNARDRGRMYDSLIRQCTGKQDGFHKAGKILKAMGEMSIKITASTFDNLMNVALKEGKYDEVVSLYRDRVARGTSLTKYSGVALMRAATKLKDEELLNEAFGAMEEFKSVFLFSYYIRYFIENKMLDRADELMEEMKSKNGGRLHGSLMCPLISAYASLENSGSGNGDAFAKMHQYYTEADSLFEDAKVAPKTLLKLVKVYEAKGMLSEALSVANRAVEDNAAREALGNNNLIHIQKKALKDLKVIAESLSRNINIAKEGTA